MSTPESLPACPVCAEPFAGWAACPAGWEPAHRRAHVELCSVLGADALATLANLAALAAAHAEADPIAALAAATTEPRRDRSGRVLVSA